MSMFQISVINKYLKTLDKQTVQIAYSKFKAHFHNPAIQENIRNSKEEQYQEGFLNDLFVNVLGYTKNPSPDFNLTTEYKNVKDSKKADGAILSRGHAPLIGNARGNIPLIENARGHAPLSAPLVTGIIELKGTNTTDLGNVEVQAFGYKNNQPECTYIITSNFEKVRFYIDNAIEHIEFNLFTLNEQDFQLLYLCLAYENIEKGIPKNIKEESISQEDRITKQLYNDYSLFKRELYQNLVALNPEYDALVVFKKSQKLLDRFLFLLFAEDRQLLPPNSVRLILKDWRDLQERDEEIPLYNRFKKYFGYLNTGFKGKRYDVFAYNGGLFKPDEVLDNLNIDDDLLYKHTFKLSEYDFESEVDVNILGHIFENSLNEMDELKAEISGETIEKLNTKRKKDGVYYTPKYITKYIVDNTVGKLCLDKKIELGITRGHAPLSAAGRHAPLSDPTKQTMYKKLTTYREWLLQITICDPACGSGAFLNQVLNFLIDEHRYIDELQAKLFGDALVLSDIENTILENNLFGVDINEESVEIAKLSLWLRTAQPNRKLNDLSRNIKCGNSLIDDPAIAGDKAFVWEQEFPQIFHKKQKKAWHITTATHNSRYSERMFDNYVKLGEPVWLWAEEELIVSQTIADITEKDKLNILAYNACGDHLHLLLVCEEKEVETIVGKLKYMSARSCNIAMGRTTTSSGHVTRGHAPLSTEKSLPERGDTQAKLWTQKFGCTEIIGEEQRYNAIAYIKNNRVKHELPESKELLQIIEKMVKTVEDAYSTEYKGGFDVVIGNPPYGAKLDNNTQKYLNEKFIKGGSETAISFVKLAYDYLLKPKGNFGFIIPKAFSFSSNYESIREFILNDINEIVDCKKVWKEVLLEQIILIFQKNKATSLYNCGRLKGQSIEIVGTIDKQYFKTFGFYLNDITNSELNIGLKIRSSNKYIGDIANNSRGGIFQNKVSETGDIDVLGGAEIQRMGITGIKGKISLNIIKGDSKCFINDNSILVQNIVAHIENPTDHIKITACLPFRKDYAIVDTINQLTFKSEFNNKVFWLILNSNLINWFSYRFIFARAIRTMHFDNSITNRIPIPSTISLSDQQPFIAKADLMLALNNQLQEVSGKFQRSIQRKFNLEDLPGKLQNWYQLTYGEFIKELGKKKIKLSLAEEAEWESYFVQETEKALAIKKQIETTDCEIDRMVYELYGLTEEEINIIEKTN